MRIRRLLPPTAAFALIASLLVLAPAESASAAPCRVGSELTRSSSKTYGTITVSASVRYAPLYSCAGTQIGIRVARTAMSYTGGFQGTDSSGYRHGINRGGGVMIQNLSSGAGCAAYSGSIGDYGYTRSYNRTNAGDVYSGNFSPDCYGYSYSTFAAGGDFVRPFGSQPLGGTTRIYWQPLSNTWLCQGGCGA